MEEVADEVLFCVTPSSYQDLALNMAEILAWVSQASYVMENLEND